MLDLEKPVRTVAGVDLAGDSEDSTAFYVLPPPPRVAEVEGKPELLLLRFIDDGRVTGGNLSVGLELVHSPQVLEQAREAMALELEEEGVELRVLPVEDATAKLLFVGREPTADGGMSEFLRRAFDDVPAAAQPPFGAHLSVALTPDGVSLVESALRSGGAPIGVVYCLRVEGLWPAQRVVVKVDWKRAYDHFSTHRREGFLLFTEDVQHITERLVEDRIVSIEVVQGVVPEDGEEVPDTNAALAFVQRDLVERFCEPVMKLSRQPARTTLGTTGELFGVGAGFAVKKLTQIEHAIGTADLQRETVVKRTFTLHAHLADLLGGAPADEHIADAFQDHPFFRTTSLSVRTARPLAELHIAEAVLHYSYGTTQEAARLTPEEPEARFDTFADASPDGTWTLRPELTIAPDAPYDPGEQIELAPLTGSSRELTLDLERGLGLRRIELRGPSDPRVLMSLVHMEQRRGEELLHEREVHLTPAAPVVVEWFRGLRPDDLLRATLKFLLATGRTVQGEPLEVDTRILRLPDPFPGVLTVHLFSDPEWRDLEQVLVALQKDEGSPAGTYTFDGASQSRAINLDMPDPSDRSFRYRMTRTWSTGDVEEDEWTTTDVPLVSVGRTAPNKLVVEVIPVGPELPSVGILLVEVELQYLDAPNMVRHTDTAILRALADRFVWEIPIEDPELRSYEYRVRVHRTSSETETGPWTRTSATLLPIPITSA